MSADIKKIQKVRENLKPKLKPPKNKSFDDYFQECIKNKTISPDTPSYLRNALERALKEYDQGILKEKSALEQFANKYNIKGKPGLLHFNSLNLKTTQLKDFLRNHRNIKVKLVLVCLMEQKTVDGLKVGFTQDKLYFHSGTHISL